MPGLEKSTKKITAQIFDKTHHAYTAFTLNFSNDAEIEALNKYYRGKAKPTNVLSFPSDEAGYLGDIILAFETVLRESSQQNKNFEHHTLHLIVHGLLHLLGYDHEKEKEAQKMEKLEISILAEFGIGNPYQI